VIAHIALDEGVDLAAARALGATIGASVLAGHAVGRVVEEWLLLKPEPSVRFPYTLRCGPGRCDERSPAQPGVSPNTDPIPQIRPTPTRQPTSTDPSVTIPPPDDATLPVEPGTGEVVVPTLDGLRITRVWTRDSTGSDRSEFSCGGQVRLSLAVDNPNQQTITQDISALAELDEQRLYYQENRFAFPPGPGLYEWVIDLPTDANGTGTYTADVFPENGLPGSDDSTRFTVGCAL
jgi:hypothetical protein